MAGQKALFSFSKTFTFKKSSVVQSRDSLSTRGSISTDAVVAHDAFRGIMEILSEAKDNTHLATRLASGEVKIRPRGKLKYG